jgi:hypothetical protein
MPSRTTWVPYDLRRPAAWIAGGDTVALIPHVLDGRRDGEDQISRSSTAGCRAEVATLS